jgi:hypothetical protein
MLKALFRRFSKSSASSRSFTFVTVYKLGQTKERPGRSTHEDIRNKLERSSKGLQLAIYHPANALRERAERQRPLLDRHHARKHLWLQSGRLSFVLRPLESLDWFGSVDRYLRRTGFR